MTSTKLLLYNCFIILLCSLDNNGVADVFVIIWLFFTTPPPLFCLLSKTSGNCGENNDCLPVCPPCLFSLDCVSQTVSAQLRLSKKLPGCLLQAGSSVSNEWFGFECLTCCMTMVSFCFLVALSLLVWYVSKKRASSFFSSYMIF